MGLAIIQNHLGYLVNLNSVVPDYHYFTAIFLSQTQIMKWSHHGGGKRLKGF